MQLGSLLSQVAAALRAGELSASAPVNSLIRVQGFPRDSEAGWRGEPIVELCMRPEEPAADLRAIGDDSEPALTVEELVTQIIERPRAFAELPVYVSHTLLASHSVRLRNDAPAIGLSWSPTELGVIAWYEGWEGETAAAL